MSYDIIVRFPNKKLAKEFCSQMTDGFGEGFCDFSAWEKLPGTDGSKHEDWKKVTGSAPDGTPVFFVNSIFDE